MDVKVEKRAGFSPGFVNYEVIEGVVLSKISLHRERLAKFLHAV
jgi:hypothetical protein